MALIFIKDQQVKELGQEWNEENLLAWFYKVFASPPSISPKEKGMQRERGSSGGQTSTICIIRHEEDEKNNTDSLLSNWIKAWKRNPPQSYTVKKFGFHHKSSLKSNKENNPLSSQ